MPLSGGAADKFGNRYEGRWTAFCMAEVLNENACSIRFEPPGVEDKGFEFLLRKEDKTEYHQVKRQKSRGGSWTLKNLASEGVLQNFLSKLKDRKNNYCIFISTQHASELDNLADRARRSASFKEFKDEFLKPKEHSGPFYQLCQFWDDCSDIIAFEYLKRIYIKAIDEDTLRDTVTISIKPLIEEDSSTVAEILANLALEEVHKELFSDNIWKHLETRGLKPRVWNKDPHVLSRCNDCTNRNLPDLYDSTIVGKVIEKEEVSIILDKLIASVDKKSVLISGEAGLGKSSIIVQVVEALKNQEIPLLAFRVDRLNPTQLPEEVGTQLGLPDSPAIVLKSIARGRPCVLIIDQLDSVSETSGKNPDFFYCINEIIKQALIYPEMHILLACRKFDLDNDHRLRSLIGKQGIADNVQIKCLSHDTIKRFIKENLRSDIDKLDKKQLDLLAVPLHLNILAEISQDDEFNAIDFRTTKDLYDKFWNLKQKLLYRRLGDSSKWVDVVLSLSNYMSEHQTLIAPSSVLDKFGNLPEAMASEHILIKDGDRYAFFHQGFFDYAFARNFCSQSYKLVPFLQKEEQHLFRRAQVRQILLHERDNDFNRYIADLEHILNEPNIRFHLKKIVFALLAELSDPTIDEWKIIAIFLRETDDPLSRGVKFILYKSIHWIKLLNTNNQLEKWLANHNEEKIDLAVTLLSVIQKDMPEIVVSLIEPYVDISEAWNVKLSKICKTSRIDASERFFNLILHFIDTGVLDEIVELDPFEGHFWYAHENIAEENAIWACKYLGHYLNRKLFLSLEACQLNPFDRKKGIIPHRIIQAKVCNSIKDCVENEPQTFIYEILPFMLRVIGFTASQNEKFYDSFYDQVWRSRFYYEGYGIYADQCVLFLMENAMVLVAKTKPDVFRNIEAIIEDLNFETIHYLLIRSFTSNGEQFAIDAASYLDNFPICFETGYMEDKYRATRQLLEAISPYCPDEQLSKLETSIMKCYPEQDNLRHKAAQYALLSGFASVRRSSFINNRLKDLEPIFGSTIGEPPKLLIGGFVKSPIPEDQAEKMTNDQWIEAIGLYKSEEAPFTVDDVDLVGSAYELSSVLEALVKKYPLRFAALIHEIPDDANIHYFNAILRGIKDSSIDPKTILDVCQRCHNIKDKPCGEWICDLISEVAEHDLPQDTLDIVAWYAIEDPDPENDIWRVKSANETPYYGGDILSAGLNSVRGRAANAVAQLIFHNKNRLSYFKPIVDKMIRDPLIEVRSWVALVLISILRYDRDLAVELFQKITETEDILLGTYHVECFLRYALHTHFPTLKPTLERMVMSKEPDVVKAGARQICIASFYLDEAIPLMELCMSGTECQKLGAAEIFSTKIKSNPEFCTEKLIKLFSDPHKSVQDRAASCLGCLDGENLEDFTDLIEAFSKSLAFESDIDILIELFKKTNRKLPEIAFRICEKFLLRSTIHNISDFSTEVDISQL